MIVGTGFARGLVRVLMVLILAPFVTAAVLLSTIDADELRARFIEQIAGYMGADVRILGPVEVEWGWPPRVTLSDVQLANSRTVGVDIITIESMESEFDVLSLATGQLQPSHLRLKGVDIVMRPDALLAGAQGLEASMAPAAGPAAAAASPLFGLSSVGSAVGAAGVSIAGASVTLVDPGTGSAATVDIVDDDTSLDVGNGGGDGNGGGGNGGGGNGNGGSGSGGNGC